MKTPRWETFSDGVFAIAITLLIIEIKVPHDGDLASGLAKVWPSFAAYIASFLFIGTWWMGHNLVGDHLERVDGAALLLNTVYLMTIAFIPFSTAVLADRMASGRDAGLAAAFYAASSLAPAIAVNALTTYALRRRLFGRKLEAIRPFLRFRWVGVVLYAIAIPFALVAPAAALAFFVISPVAYGVILSRQRFVGDAGDAPEGSVATR